MIVYQKLASGIGRPSKITPSNLSKFKEYISLWHTVEESAFACGFSVSAFYRFLDKNPEFREEIRNTKWVYTRLLAKQNINKAISEGDIQVSLQFLKHTDPEWRMDKDRVTINNGPQNAFINIDPKRAMDILKSLEKKAQILESWRYWTITHTRHSTKISAQEEISVLR
jgi:hypothetical protein